MLNVGKLSENVLKRSVIRMISHDRDDVVINPSIGADYAVVDVSDSDKIVTATSSITHIDVDCAKYAVESAINNIAVSGAKACFIETSVILPIGFLEEDLKEIIKSLNDVCARHKIELIGGHTEVTSAVVTPIITVSAIGKVNTNQFISPCGAKPGDDVVMTKWIGLEGTSIIAKKNELELKKRFSPAFVDKAIAFDNMMSIADEATIAIANGAKALHDVSKGGIFGALWELSEGSKVGLTIDLMAIKVRQETVEICEEYGINPYELISGGALLITTGNGHDLVRELEASNIAAAVIGKVTDSNDRVIINGDEKRFLYRPKSDEIYGVTNSSLKGKD